MDAVNVVPGVECRVLGAEDDRQAEPIQSTEVRGKTNGRGEGMRVYTRFVQDICGLAKQA